MQFSTGKLLSRGGAAFFATVSMLLSACSAGYPTWAGQDGASEAAAAAAIDVSADAEYQAVKGAAEKVWLVISTEPSTYNETQLFQSVSTLGRLVEIEDWSSLPISVSQSTQVMQTPQIRQAAYQVLEAASARPDSYDRALIKRRVDFLIASLAASSNVEQERLIQQTPSQNLPVVASASPNLTAFSSFKRGEDAEVAKVKSQLRFPVLGLNSLGAKARVDYKWGGGGKWYLQTIDLSANEGSPFRLIQVQGSAAYLADAANTPADVQAAQATYESPRVSIEGDSEEFPDSVRADFALGNIAYAVSMVCKPTKQYACRDESGVRKAVANLKILGGY